MPPIEPEDRKSTRLNSSHLGISYAVFCLKKKKKIRLRADAARSPAVKGNLIDTSARGVRARHDCDDLTSGQIVTFDLFFFNDTATTEIYPLSLHDALPI